MNIISSTSNEEFPLKWADLKYFPASKAQKCEIYLKEYTDTIGGLITLFDNLFGTLKEEITIYNSSWWDFCLDTWDPNKDQYDYTASFDNKSKQSINYIRMLQESNIKIGYTGNCKCNNWNKFLEIILECIISHQAPYSPIFYSEEHNFFFYFHHSGSIGLYFKDSELVNNILDIAQNNYDII